MDCVCVCVSSCDHVACDHSYEVSFVFGQALHVPKQPTLKRNKESQTKRQRVYVDILSGGTYSSILRGHCMPKIDVSMLMH